MARTRLEADHSSNIEANASGALQAEAAALLSRPNREDKAARKLETRPLAVTESGDYQVRRGDSLVAIAQRSLVYQDKYPDWGSVQDEVNRIVALNQDRYPQLAKNRNKIDTDMVLRIVDNDKTEQTPRDTRSRIAAGNPPQHDVAASTLHRDRLPANPVPEESVTPNRTRPLELREGGTHVVLPRENINSIARGALALRGRPDAPEPVVNAEAVRIIELNSKFYPELTTGSPQLRTNMILQIHDKSVGPDPKTEWKPWREVEAGTTTVAGHGERITAPKGARVIQRKGSIVEYMPGSQGFVFDGQAIAYGGSSLTAAGGTIEQFPGARVVFPQGSRAGLIERS